MKISDIIERVEFTDGNKCMPDWEAFESTFGMCMDYDYDKFTKGLVGYYFYKWHCTDQYVGGVVYFLKDGHTTYPVAISQKHGRKRTTNIQYLSDVCVEDVKKFMLSCVSEGIEDEYDILDIDTDFGDGYNVEYGSQLLKHEGIYEPTGDRVLVTETWTSTEDIKKWREVRVRELRSDMYVEPWEKVVDLNDILFSYGS